MSVALIWVAAAERGAGAAIACTIYSLTIIGLFTVSATYHRHDWTSVRARTWMKRADHSMIFVFIAGTYTPFCGPATARSRLGPWCWRWCGRALWAASP